MAGTQLRFTECPMCGLENLPDSLYGLISEEWYTQPTTNLTPCWHRVARLAKEPRLECSTEVCSLLTMCLYPLDKPSTSWNVIKDLINRGPSEYHFKKYPHWTRGTFTARYYLCICHLKDTRCMRTLETLRSARVGERFLKPVIASWIDMVTNWMGKKTEAALFLEPLTLIWLYPRFCSSSVPHSGQQQGICLPWLNFVGLARANV